VIASSDIPNLKQWDPIRWRGGEPTAAGWDYLAGPLGVTATLMLDDRCEGTLALARQRGIKVFYHPVSWLRQMTTGPDTEDFLLGLQRVHDWAGPLYVHCLHGQDRTGLGVAAYRVTYGGWTKAQAEVEMLACGFHKSLVGLWWWWKRFQ
jgi:hypothetical protein